jgi:hypothetical protein
MSKLGEQLFLIWLGIMMFLTLLMFGGFTVICIGEVIKYLNK